MRVRLCVLTSGPRVRIRRSGPAGERGLWLVGDRLVGSGLHDPAYELRHQPSGRTRILRRSRLRITRTTRAAAGGDPSARPTPARRPGGGPTPPRLAAAAHPCRELVVVLLRHAPEAEVARVLDQLPAGDLQRLASLLAHAAELHHDQDHDQDAVPPGRAGSSAATPTRP